MKIRITADGTCDLSPALIEEHAIGIMPLAVLKDGEEYLDGVDIVPADVFAQVSAGGALCTTSARNPEEYRESFLRWMEGYDALIHVSLGSGFSVSFKNARIAAEELPNVYVVDSCNLSTGQGLVVMEACTLSRSCEDAQTIVKKLNDLCPRVEASFVIDRLDYMVKGGRCSAVAALGANLMRLKPCIEVKDGAMKLAKKYRGTYENCLRAYVKERLSQPGIRRDRLFITYTEVSDPVLEAVRGAIAEFSPFAEVHETRAGCVVSCHCGPNTLGVLFIREE